MPNWSKFSFHPRPHNLTLGCAQSMQRLHRSLPLARALARATASPTVAHPASSHGAPVRVLPGAAAAPLALKSVNGPGGISTRGSAAGIRWMAAPPSGGAKKGGEKKGAPKGGAKKPVTTALSRLRETLRSRSPKQHPLMLCDTILPAPAARTRACHRPRNPTRRAEDRSRVHT